MGRSFLNLCGLLTLLALLSLFPHQAQAQSATDPSAYAPMGSPLWEALAARSNAPLPPDLLPFTIFVDGENLTMIPRAFVAQFSPSPSNKIKILAPGAVTVKTSDKYKIVEYSTFLSLNDFFVNRVTRSNPVQRDRLNIFTTSSGTPCAAAYMGE